MKTKSFITASVIMAAITLSNAKAQFVMNTSYDTNFKTAQYNNATAGKTSKTDERVLNTIKLNAVRDFMKRYSAATNAKWFVADGGFIAKFNQGTVQTTVEYNKAGNWVRTINRYYEKDMPADARAIVKRTYYDYAILSIEEISLPENEHNVFLVHVQDATTLKILRVCDKEMDLLHDYIRGDK